jgi:hypothetical protein
LSEPESENLASSARGIRDAAALLPFLASVLLAPPIILIFAAPARIGEIPLIVLYIFGVWAAVILAALLLARKLARVGSSELPPDQSGPH